MELRKRRILIVSKQTKYGLEKSIELVRLLEKKAEVFMDPTSARKLRKKSVQIKKFDGDIIITVGGDGTLLLTASQTNIPLLPVRIGGYGFLCTIDFDDLTKNLDKLLNLDFYVEERLRLKCTRIVGSDIEKYMSKIWKKKYPHSLNEVVFTRKRPSKIMEVEFTIDDHKFSFVGDGLLISTPSGSTGYHSSAGGSMADPSMQLISITPLYPFFSKLKPLIVPANKKIEVTVKRGEIALIIDGHDGDYFGPKADFLIEKGKPSKIINLIDSSFYGKIKDRFLKEKI